MEGLRIDKIFSGKLFEIFLREDGSIRIRFRLLFLGELLQKLSRLRNVVALCSLVVIDDGLSAGDLVGGRSRGFGKAEQFLDAGFDCGLISFGDVLIRVQL